MADVKDQGLVSLDDDDWAVAEGEPDVRGWRVVSADDKKIGEVEDLLAEPHVDVQRRPVTDSAARPDVEISADEIRVPIYEEEAIVEKRPVLKEEVIISKRPSEKTERSEADALKEPIDVDEHADVRSKAEPNRSRE